MAEYVPEDSRRRKWHIDGINSADSEADRLSRAMSLARAELKRCEVRRPEDAVGLRRQLAYLIAAFALDVHKVRPAHEFREVFPPLPGGGWKPKPRSDARHPRGVAEAS